MSKSLMMELQEFPEHLKLDNSFNSENIYSFHLSNLNISKITKSEFADHFHFLCKGCNGIPIIKFIEKNKIKYICKCKDSPKKLLIKDIFNYLIYSDNIEDDPKELKCNSHPNEKYIYYCEKCKKNICNICLEKCIEHEKKIKPALDKNTIDKSKYIMDKINEKNKISTDEDEDNNSIDLDEDNNPHFKLVCNKKISQNDEKQNEISSGDNIIIVKNERKNIENIDEEEFIDIVNENSKDKLYDEENIFLELCSIILYDYHNYPNQIHKETISDLEKYTTLYFGDFNEINLKYEFQEENVKYNSLELFGEIFVNNNYENCFLAINKKIIELSRYIELSTLFENSNVILNWPIKLEVKLIERKSKIMNNMSFMFYGITTLQPTSNFSEFNTINITKMSYMFYNCSTITKLPNISKFNTKNVTDMSYMFYNCSSLLEFPDISRFNTSNIRDISYMFYNCSSILKLPDISIWNMENVVDMNNMFCNCESLISIPDISNWNINNNIRNISKLFNNCKSLISLPKISKWKIKRDLFTKDMIDGCNKLEINFKEKENTYTNILNFLKRINNITDSCFEYALNIFFICMMIVFFFYFLLVAYFPIYISINIVELGYSTINPLEYFNLNNYTNISYIAASNNITNLTQIIEEYENEKNFLNHIINFTFINGGIPFESDSKKLKY